MFFAEYFGFARDLIAKGMGDLLKSVKERSKKRKRLLAQTVSEGKSNKYKFDGDYRAKYATNLTFDQLGVSSVEDLKYILGTAEVEETSSPKSVRDDDEKTPTSKKSYTENLFYRDSSTFLKV